MTTTHLDRLSAALAKRYRIERELGEGGMATVYLAEDLKHKRRVAIKVLKPELAALLGAERFVQEITTTAALQHPHILPLFDSGETDGFLYYVMPFIDGETLRAKLNRETQLGIDESVRITSAVADALEYAHRHGVIHRDIKPENILLQDGRPMVADFGIALAVSAAAGGRMTETGLSLGTPHYMSPEQATAEKEISARSDVYSLASVLYEMLAGQPPHLGGSAQQIIMKIIAEQPAAVTTLRRSVPPNVAAAVAQALEKVPADRFESAKAFGDALGNVAFRSTTVSPVGGLTSRPMRWPVLATTLVLGVALGVLGMRTWPAGTAPIGELGRQQLTFNGLARRPAISPDGQFVAFVETACKHGTFSLCHSSLLVQEVGSTQARVLITNAAHLMSPRWSHDGLSVVIAGRLDEGREGLFAVPRLTGTPQRVGPVGVYDTHASADSVLLVPVRETGREVALIIALGSGATVDSFPMPFGRAADVSWSPDGRRVAAQVGAGIALFGRDGRLTDSLPTRSRNSVRWNRAGTAVMAFAIGTVREDELMVMRVSRDGRFAGPPEIAMRRVPTLYRGSFDVARRTGQIILETGDAVSDLWSFDLTAQPVQGRRETRGTTWYGEPTVSPDGRTLYYFRGDARGDNVYTRNLATGVEEALTSQRLPGGEATRFSTDGRRLVYGHRDTVARVEYIEFPSRQVFSFPAAVWPDRVEPVAAKGFAGILPRTGMLGILDSLGGSWRSLPVPDSLSVQNLSASPDARRIAIVAVPRQAAELTPGYVASLGGRSQILGVMSVTDGALQVIRTFGTDEPEMGVSWADDRTLLLKRWPDTEDTPSIWRLTVADGQLTRVVTIPVACTPNTIAVAASGRTAVCRADDFRSDIWLIDAPGVTR